MELVYIVIALALLQFFIFGGAVGWARVKYNVAAPTSIGTIIAFILLILEFAIFVAVGLGVWGKGSSHIDLD
jgi:hypothetical protein